MELFNYMSENATAIDILSVKNAHQFLEACHKIFEKGFLSHEKIINLDEVLQSLLEGYQFFTNWIDQTSRT